MRYRCRLRESAQGQRATPSGGPADTGSSGSDTDSPMDDNGTPDTGEPVKPAEEICDGLDNDLDGEIDGAIFSKDLSWEADPKEEIKKYKVGDSVKVKIISNENEKVALSIREVSGNPYDELRDKTKGDVVTCSVLETGDYGVKVKIGEKGPITIIKKSDLALRKSDARPDRWARNDKLDASITYIDISNFKVSLSIRAMEDEIEKEAMEKYGSKDSGASLGAILGKALGRDKKED